MSVSTKYYHGVLAVFNTVPGGSSVVSHFLSRGELWESSVMVVEVVVCSLLTPPFLINFCHVGSSLYEGWGSVVRMFLPITIMVRTLAAVVLLCIQVALWCGHCLFPLTPDSLRTARSATLFACVFRPYTTYHLHNITPPQNSWTSATCFFREPMQLYVVWLFQLTKPLEHCWICCLEVCHCHIINPVHQSNSLYCW